MYYSFVVPTFNRPDEVGELLESFRTLELPSAGFDGLEVILADGSPTEILTSVVDLYKNKIILKHIHVPGLAISPARNLGAQHARGEYIVFLDSDVILPTGYIRAIHESVSREPVDAFGGPDASHPSFNRVQKAISYAMTSYLTTGGIRGKKKQFLQYNPRGFNMGIRKKVFDGVGGYSSFSCGEDIELSIRIIKAGYVVKLVPEAFVYHKRRNTFKSFFRQVFRFGAARINIFYRHRSELKIVHAFPTLFFLFLAGGFLMSLFLPTARAIFISVLTLYYSVIFLDATLQNNSLRVGVLSMVTATLQLCGYGLGFLANAYTVFVKGKTDGISLGPSK